MTTLPVIHINGTSAATLASDYGQALELCDAALRAARAVEFNQRDYYPLGESAWREAVTERESVIASLETASAYFATLFLHCTSEAEKKASKQ